MQLRWITVLLCVTLVQSALPAADEEPSRSKPLAVNPELKSFLNCQIRPQFGNHWDYTFAPGKFPKVGWDRPDFVKHYLGEFPLKVRWFDADLNEVTEAEKPGRYAYYAEGTTPDGRIIRRAATVFCRPRHWAGWSERLQAHLEYVPIDGVSPEAWERHRDAIAGFAGRTILRSILRQREGAILMAFLYEMENDGKGPGLTDTPMIRDHDYHLALKRKLLQVENQYPPLKPPGPATGEPTPVLRNGREKQAGLKPGTVRRLRQACQAWFEDSEEPFNMAVARHGVMVMNDSFGDWSWGKLTRETPTEMASITKLLTGLLFARFVDQGLISIDDPVGKYLPDFPVTGDNVLTLRQCFTHSAALFGHEEWNGLHNPWLDNVIANAVPNLAVGRWHQYNGMGYDLAGKVMEVVSGRSVFRLMREQLFDPLELPHTTLEEDLGFSCFSTAEDFAIIGQMILNHGSYRERKYFSPETFQKLLPIPLQNHYPKIKKDWGIGITWMRQRHPEAGKNSIPKEATLLSRNVIGHGSATGAILRVDLDNELVITQSRRRHGRNYSRHLRQCLAILDEGLIKSKEEARP